MKEEKQELLKLKGHLGTSLESHSEERESAYVFSVLTLSNTQIPVIDLP